MYRNLVDFKAEFGHTLVPQKTEGRPDLSALGKWVSHQRAYYRYFKEGHPSQVRKSKGDISLSRIESLNQIGFIWNTNDYNWENVRNVVNCFLNDIVLHPLG